MIIPKANEDDVLIEDKYRDMITIVPVSKITEVLELSLVGKEKDGLLETIKRFSKRVSIPIPDINLPAPSYGAGASR